MFTDVKNERFDRMCLCVYLQMSRTRDLTECVCVCMFTDVKNERFDRMCLCVCLQMSRMRDLTECVCVYVYRCQE